MIPPEGIRFFTVFLHTHEAGRSVRLLHYRDDNELPYISYDENYNFNYQQNRLLHEEREILPGDKLYVRCVYENTDREGNSTIGGYSTREEMCSAFVWYYNKMDGRPACISDLRAEEYRNFLQIYNTSWSNSQLENIITRPDKNGGLLVSEVANYRTDWTLGKRMKIQEYHKTLPQISICRNFMATANSSDSSVSTTTKQPNILRRNRFDIYPEKAYDNEAVYSESTSSYGLQNSEFEYVSVYPSKIKSYERPGSCNLFNNIFKFNN